MGRAQHSKLGKSAEHLGGMLTTTSKPHAGFVQRYLAPTAMGSSFMAGSPFMPLGGIVSPRSQGVMVLYVHLPGTGA
jgi:hypothetical protein